MQITSHGSSAKMVEWTVWPSEAMQTLHLFIWLTWSACLMWSACQTVMWPPLSVFNVSICLKNPLTLIALSQIPCTRVSSFNLLKWHYKISTLYMCTFFFFFSPVCSTEHKHPPVQNKLSALGQVSTITAIQILSSCAPLEVFGFGHIARVYL